MWQLFPMGFQAFKCWLRDNFKEVEAQGYLDRYIQSGDYPEEFLEELKSGQLDVM